MKGVFIVIVLVLFFVFRNKKEGSRGNRRKVSSSILTDFLFSKKERNREGIKLVVVIVKLFFCSETNHFYNGIPISSRSF